MSSLRIRSATLNDAESIAAIYNYEVENSTATFDLVPRTTDEQRAWIEGRLGAFAAIVAEHSRFGVVGFAALSTYRDRAAYRTTVEDSIYVQRSHQKIGIGRLLLAELLDLAQQSGFHTVIARVDSLSQGSIALHRSMGFETVGVEREVGRKFGRWLDSLILQKMLS